jgi:hypothetical protein
LTDSASAAAEKHILSRGIGPSLVGGSAVCLAGDSWTDRPAQTIDQRLAREPDDIVDERTAGVKRGML